MSTNWRVASYDRCVFVSSGVPFGEAKEDSKNLEDVLLILVDSPAHVPTYLS